MLGVILPHHLLVEGFMDEFYQNLALNKYKRVVIVSPNHFSYGFRYIQSSATLDTEHQSPALDIASIKALKTAGTIFVEPKNFTKEHGIHTHYRFINKYFPDATIVPIILKQNTPQENLDRLVKAITALDLSDTLIVASIDFTHYTAEKFALKNDERTIDYLKMWSKNPLQPDLFSKTQKLAHGLDQTIPGAVAMDSPETFYTLLQLMQKTSTTNFNLWKRTSSASLTGIQDPAENTSHLFATFGNIQVQSAL